MFGYTIYLRLKTDFIPRIIHVIASSLLPLDLHAGIFTLPIENLRDPPAYLRIREFKEWYVDYLATLLLNEDAEDLTAPFVVVASVSAAEFKRKKLNRYTVEV